MQVRPEARGVARRGAVLLVVCAGLLAMPAGAALPAIPDLAGAGAAPPDAGAAAPRIEAKQDKSDDIEIARRIRNIFSAIGSLSQVQVKVEEGVVTLTGSVSQADDRKEAEAIATRVNGVVTVANQIERDLDVGSNLAPTIGNMVDQTRNVVRSLPLIGAALLVAIIVALLFAGVARMHGLLSRVTPNAFVTELLSSAIRFVGVLFGAYLALKILGATALLGALLGIGGVVGIAIGFAVRDTIDNYISSVMLSLRQPFRANDHVVIEGSEGRVVRLTSRATLLMTLDGNHLRIPNSTVFKAVILNYTRNPQRRFTFELGVDADDDPVDGMATGMEALSALGYVLDDPEPGAVIQQVGDSNIVIEFMGWVDQTHTDFLKGRSIAIKAVKQALEEAGFALPEPIYRLRFDAGNALLNANKAQIMAADGQAGPQQRSDDRQRERSSSDQQRPRPRRANSGSQAQAQSTRPENHVAELVQQERSGAAEKDLLDANRPIE
ncbi:mechanosensitive ion channel family protein [Croceicoccus sp. F390]|uniref:Small-conductance mechanosensitive channel n=1 Tax=Croceicoccus esteveae TaxID=3075597 RepID=A0ABU2ZDA4_9SPHN|nr:mechanosensitive ion channel family protein [Croceicoccus sp. F390]MDT0574584.1 mechanosensitive ion channel family protein [Croceicoccus sp. F390]